jgi:hypothetical protein
MGGPHERIRPARSATRMAELPDVQAAVVLAWFADAYNRARGSA